ncbi:MAG: hypothetical protein GXY92_01230 [Syntrophomonadaceae bacterium]|nr:hypothetical protein [Syntrophomonadaceae bacterium]
MAYLKPGEIAPHDGFYITRGYSVFLRQGQAMPLISPEIPDIEAELGLYPVKDGEERGSGLSL